MSYNFFCLKYCSRSHACGADTLAAAGALRLRNGDPRRAFQLLGSALAQQPTQHPAALALAAMMLQHKDLDAALARLKAALSAHTTCVAAHSNLGLALMAKKKYIAVRFYPYIKTRCINLPNLES